MCFSSAQRLSCMLLVWLVWVNQVCVCVCVCVCRFFPAGLKPKASACDGRCELTPIRRGNKKSSCFWDKAICYHSHPHRLDNGKVPRRRRRYKYMGGWWCVGQWRKKESRDATRQARTGNSPRTWPPNRHLGARPATVLVAAVNRILPSVCLASVCSGFSSFSGPS